MRVPGSRAQPLESKRRHGLGSHAREGHRRTAPPLVTLACNFMCRARFPIVLAEYGSAVAGVVSRRCANLSPVGTCISPLEPSASRSFPPLRRRRPKPDIPPHSRPNLARSPRPQPTDRGTSGGLPRSWRRPLRPSRPDCRLGGPKSRRGPLRPRTVSRYPAPVRPTGHAGRRVGARATALRAARGCARAPNAARGGASRS